MRFHLVDRIESIEPGKRIVGVKNVSLAEEYLADHFPAFPVLPGVLMLESLVQTAAWLVRLEQGWSRSLIQLAAVRNVRYGNFVAPGDSLRTEVELTGIEGDVARCKGTGSVGDGSTAVHGRFELRCQNVADVFGPAAEMGADERIVARLREHFKLIGGPEALAAAAAARD